MNATVIDFPHAATPKVERTTILTLKRGPAVRAYVVEERCAGMGTTYLVIVENIFVTGSQTIVGPISGQHHAIAMARASVG